MRQRLCRVAACVLFTLAAACATPPAQQDQDTTAQQDSAAPVATGQGGDVPNQLTDQERQDGWRLLFDGVTTAGWRGWNQPDAPAGWRVVDGALTRVQPGVDLITNEQFRNFDLRFDWRIRPGGNSGVFFRVVEGPGLIYHYAPEYQILDDDGHPDGRAELTSAGANYALHPAPRGVVRPVGEWNSGRIVVRDNRVEHWLNDRQIVDYVMYSDDWKARVANSKFADWENYARSEVGHIGLQDHGSWVAFRSIRIRTFP